MARAYIENGFFGGAKLNDWIDLRLRQDRIIARTARSALDPVYEAERMLAFASSTVNGDMVGSAKASTTRAWTGIGDVGGDPITGTGAECVRSFGQLNPSPPSEDVA